MIAESNGRNLFGGGESAASVGLIERSLTVNGMTCGACVSHVERALRGVSGVAEAKVSLDRAEAKVRYDAAVTGFAAFREAVQAAGYDLTEDSALDQSPSSQAFAQPLSVRSIAWPAIIGLIAAALLASFYILIIGITQDFGHAIELVVGDWYFVIPIALGFGVQVGLFVYVRRVLKLRKSARTANAVTEVGTGTSTVSMIACCAHHLADIVPILGLSGAAVFLNDNRGPFMALGIAGNMVWNAGAVTARASHIGRTVDEGLARLVTNLASRFSLALRLFYLRRRFELPGMDQRLVAIDTLLALVPAMSNT